MKTKFKKIDENTFERTDVRSSKTILNKEELERSKKLLEKEVVERQGKLAQINENLKGIRKAK